MKRPAPTRDLIAELPKSDLHLHLDGSLRLDTLIELAKEQKVKLPSRTPAPETAPLRHSRAETSKSRKIAANSALPTTGEIIGASGVRSWNWRSNAAVAKVAITMIQARPSGILKPSFPS